EGNGPSGGDPRDLGILGASTDVFALDLALLDLLHVDPTLVPTIVAARGLGVCPEFSQIHFPKLHPSDLQVLDWKLPEALMPIDFGLPRILRSTFKHFYIRFIQEPMAAYSDRK
ncbi:MAG: thylakoid-associated protein, partial [Spirulina sp.]